MGNNKDLYENRGNFWQTEIRYFSHIQPKFHNWLGIEIKLDHCQSYKLNSHPLWIYFKNGYGESEEWLPLMVEEEPYVPFSDYSPKVSRKHFRQLCRFVGLHSEWIRDLADGEIDVYGFVDSVEAWRKILDSQKEQNVSAEKDQALMSHLITRFRVAPDPRFYCLFIRKDDESRLPHIHIGDNATYPVCSQFHAMLMLEEPDYLFIDEDAEDILDERMLKGLISALSSTNEDGETDWRYALKSWNMNHQDKPVSISTAMPDYSLLADFWDC